jgi:hypothetical protein
VTALRPLFRTAMTLTSFLTPVASAEPRPRRKSDRSIPIQIRYNGNARKSESDQSVRLWVLALCVRLFSATLLDRLLWLRRSREHRPTEGVSDPYPCQTNQQPADGHGIPPLAATKGWHLPAVQFPRHSAIAHKARRPEFLNHRCQGPGRPAC